MLAKQLSPTQFSPSAWQSGRADDIEYHGRIGLVIAKRFTCKEHCESVESRQIFNEVEIKKAHNLLRFSAKLWTICWLPKDAPVTLLTLYHGMYHNVPCHDIQGNQYGISQSDLYNILFHGNTNLAHGKSCILLFHYMTSM